MARLDRQIKNLDVWVSSEVAQLLRQGPAKRSQGVNTLVEVIAAARVSVRYGGWHPSGASKTSEAYKGGGVFLPLILAQIPVSSSSSELKALCTSYVSLLAEEITCSVGVEDDKVDFALPTLVLLTSKLISTPDAGGKLLKSYRKTVMAEVPSFSVDALFAVTSTLSKSTKKWSAGAYAAAVRLLVEHISQARPSQASEAQLDTVALLRLSDVLLRNAPEGKVMAYLHLAEALSDSCVSSWQARTA